MNTINNMDTSLTPQDNKSERTISIKIPKLRVPGFQSIVLILLIVVGLIQTTQLLGLQQNIASAQINKSSSSVSAPAANSGNSALPTMVGGC